MSSLTVAADLFGQLVENQGMGPHYEAEGDDVATPASPPVRLLCFYLPQFHPIPENDAWWGKGFTEWTNVSKAVPRFVGHYQPHLPADLGFYDLRLVDTLRAQAKMAKRYGIEGFGIHYYRFGEKRLLNAPLDLLHANPDIDLPFFLNWANENWTRRWDGNEKSILLGQHYSPEDDIAFVDGILPFVRDRRYVRINGRPLLMLYRPGLLPDAKATVDRWRRRFAEHGEADPFLMMTHGFDDLDPRKYGIDAAVQFPPHDMGRDIKTINELFAMRDPDFTGAIFNYGAMADRFAKMDDKPYRLFKTVSPGWDNDARRPNAGTIYAGSEPKRYGRWLAESCRWTLSTHEPGERCVFVNAWNEWAEGAHLEPDRHFGHAYLRETARVLSSASSSVELDRHIAERMNLNEIDESQLAGWQKVLGRALRKSRNLVRTLGESQ